MNNLRRFHPPQWKRFLYSLGYKKQRLGYIKQLSQLSNNLNNKIIFVVLVVNLLCLLFDITVKRWQKTLGKAWLFYSFFPSIPFLQQKKFITLQRDNVVATMSTRSTGG